MSMSNWLRRLKSINPSDRLQGFVTNYSYNNIGLLTSVQRFQEIPQEAIAASWYAQDHLKPSVEIQSILGKELEQEETVSSDVYGLNFHVDFHINATVTEDTYGETKDEPELEIRSVPSRESYSSSQTTTYRYDRRGLLVEEEDF